MLLYCNYVVNYLIIIFRQMEHKTIKCSLYNILKNDNGDYIVYNKSDNDVKMVNRTIIYTQ